jgi:hypothetical protein
MLETGRFGEGFRTPARCRTVVRGAGAGVRKPPKEETAGRKSAVWWGAAYGDLEVADGAPASAGKGQAEDRVDRKDDDKLV